MTRIDPQADPPPEGETAGETVGTGSRASAATDGGPRRTRRHDPGRKTHILDATLDVIVEHGVAGTTHRHIAARAGVPLGSITYHFTGLTDLLAQAFARHVELQSAAFKDLFHDVGTQEQFVETLVGLVDTGPSRHRGAVLGFELHLAALRSPRLRALTRAWTQDSRAVLARFTGPDRAADLDALLEGMIMHALLTTVPESRETTRDTLVRMLGPTGRPGT
ncbi:TetR/AcrR family transcriptional regulator [Streptomyces sp. NBC_01497]|uniref:TetR/AcrR family transcriptional regulator n=1 Tax=Streptomyces sp. NBC_01497 TaxID=2903885 RepID=UPI002E3574A1|nr:TetR family transcriptional regulator [Streptomyces sp. NBC_01497]